MVILKIQCPAKINLSLKILDKRPDGFHNIESIMQSVSLYDYLYISVTPYDYTEILLAGNTVAIPYNEKNLVYKAAEIFMNFTKLPPHRINIYIEKRIPISAGLAGGSSDAAGAMFGLNRIFGEPLTHERIHQLCSFLGSDLNFCLEGGCIAVRGRGEILHKLPYQKAKISLIKPERLGISARDAYNAFSRKRELGIKCSFGKMDKFDNDLEWALIDDYPELQKIKKKYSKSVMSGSGSAYFAINTKFKPMDGYWIENDLLTTDRGVCEVEDDLAL